MTKTYCDKCGGEIKIFERVILKTEGHLGGREYDLCKECYLDFADDTIEARALRSMLKKEGDESH